MKINKESVALAIAIGIRMRDSRDLCGYNIKESAGMLGVSKELLGRYESGVNIAFIPTSIISKAAQLYDVSTDYLFCLSDDWERDPVVLAQRQFGVLTHTHHIKKLSELAVQVATQQQQIDGLNESVQSLLTAIAEIDIALSIFQNMNDFDNLSGGSKLLFRIKQANGTAESTIRLLVRHNLLDKTHLPEIKEQKNARQNK